LQYETQTIDLASGHVEIEHAQIDTNARNINDMFKLAKRSLGDAAAKWYWDQLCEEGENPDRAKIVVAALAEFPTVASALESAAESLIDSWRNEYNSMINDLPEAKRAGFYTIWETARKPQQITLILPVQITASEKGEPYPSHVYANEKKLFPLRVTGWEGDVLAAELAKPSLVAWYRNPPGTRAALAVPYEESNAKRTMYPDFLFFHEIEGEIVCDVVDPHAPHEADAGPKWRGLAAYAAEHGHHFRRILAVIKSTGANLLSLDLKNPAAVEKLATANNETDIRTAFASAGGPY
jgi:type III restriction enzyme